MVTCIPSRGLIHSRTIESVNKQVPFFDVTHNLPIPDCFNHFVELYPTEDLLFVEEDMYLPPTTVVDLQAMDVDIATANYKLPGGIDCVKEVNGYTLGGTGCTLIKRKVFDTIGGFKTDTVWNLIGNDLVPDKQRKARVYGKHDIDFYVRAQQAGFTVGVLHYPVGHLRVKQYGEERNNVGWHDITELA